MDETDSRDSVSFMLYYHMFIVKTKFMAVQAQSHNTHTAVLSTQEFSLKMKNSPDINNDTYCTFTN